MEKKIHHQSVIDLEATLIFTHLVNPHLSTGHALSYLSYCFPASLDLKEIVDYPFFFFFTQNSGKDIYCL